ncbi:MAG: hypothetical protein ACLFST_08440 [Spirochaetia bacterium]
MDIQRNYKDASGEYSTDEHQYHSCHGWGRFIYLQWSEEEMYRVRITGRFFLDSGRAGPELADLRLTV